MANASQVKALVKSHADGDNTRFYAIAMQVAAQAARSGHARFAEELRLLVDQSKTRSEVIEAAPGPRPIPMLQPRGELAGLLSVDYPRTRLSEMVLEEPVYRRINRVLLEQRQRERIKAHGFNPIQKLLLVGPPGTGKTMTAAALAGELGLPLFTILLDGLITKYLGETAAKLRLVFDAICDTRGVYLFDEIDALGGARDAKNDVGEVRRILNSFLQFLERPGPDGLVVGATNHVDLLDRALFRRFDAVIEYTLPGPVTAMRVMQARLNQMDVSIIDWNRAAAAAKGLSHAEIGHASEQAAKNAILDHTVTIGNSELIEALSERKRSHV